MFTPMGTADFDESFMTINGVYPGTSPGVWTVRDGDSLKSIASALWGDETLWYVLADANGLKSTDELKAGRLLTVPNKVTNVHNTASTFKPYDPGKAIGNTQPTLPDPPPPPSRGGGCCGFLPVIAIVVAVVATVFTAGALTAPAGASFSAMMSAGGTALTGGAGLAGVGASVVGGAVGAASAQGAMIAGGAQSGFDWKGVALGAVGGGVTAGAGGALGATNSVASAIAQGAVRSVATQGIGVATGLQHSFDWKGVAASAIASGAGYQAGALANQAGTSLGFQMGSDGGRFASGLVAGMAAGSASMVVRGGSLGRNIGAIAADAVASTVGNMVADQMQAASAAKNNATPMHPDDAQFLGALTGAIEAYSNTPSPYAGAQFAGPGALESVRELGFLPTMEVRPDRAWIDGGSGAYGPGYGGALAAWSSSDLVDTSKVDLNAAAFRSAMNAAPALSWDALSGVQAAGPAAGEIPLDAAIRGYRGGYAGVLDPSPGAAYAGKLVGDAAQSFKNFGYQMIGAESADAARAAWNNGNYGTAAAKQLQAFGEAGLALMGGGGALRQAFARTVESTVGTSVEMAAQAGGAGGARFVRTDGLGTHSTMAELRTTGALPGEQGVILSDRTVRFGDVYDLATLGGRRVEFSLVTERVDGAVVKKLYSGDAWTSPVPRDARLIGHVHPNENAFQMWPSTQDMNMVNARYFRELTSNPNATPLPTRIFWGPGSTDNTIFYPGFGKSPMTR
ncbi:hypothetical protein CFB40_16100 [Burkholderia sp. AU31652]|uniref:LysM peptidoglycan-binding domain-containing protein n=1 Tax=Burkholderia sp. AU31652 TaxID=2015354 RepID=UPI000B922A92|nr:LysM peptidoglycan-binding domain-containing protein [Burkholderia sp. AU31652]OXI87196.1 hypothetical protein CFB40_16100 [Burkholderia sp. AU31652]